MARSNLKRVTRVQPSSWAAFQGTFAAIVGLGVAILHSVDSVARVAGETDSVLRGMAFGLATGVVSLLVLPLVYFALGWLVGLVQGWAFNIILGTAGGLVVSVEDE